MAQQAERVTAHSLHSESIDVVATDDPAWPIEVRVGRGTDIHLSAAGADRLYLLLGLAINRVSADLESALTNLPEVNICE